MQPARDTLYCYGFELKYVTTSAITGQLCLEATTRHKPGTDLLGKSLYLPSYNECCLIVNYVVMFDGCAKVSLKRQEQFEAGGPLPADGYFKVF